MAPLFLFLAALGGFLAPGMLLLALFWSFGWAALIAWGLLPASLLLDLRDTSILTCMCNIVRCVAVTGT